jgi:glycosyltransferase involved in cell wall biosynthesis
VDDAKPEPIANVVLVSHCDFTGNSALHVLAVASGLHARGLSPVIAVPANAESVDDVGRPPFPVLTYAEGRTEALRFPDGRRADLVHCITPREIVRRFAADVIRDHGCRYVVHLEDNEAVVASAELRGIPIGMLRRLPGPLLDRVVGPSRFHPVRGQRFLENAAGATVIVERLLELVPPDVPSAVVGAGFDEAVLAPRRPREEVRAELGLDARDIAIVYPGSIHRVNAPDMRDLYAAVAALRRDGRPVVLVKTGLNSPEALDLPQLGEGLLDLGWVERDAVPELLAAADVLVQPGRPDPYNDYRFPSKLPEFLASGRPVVLPRTNVGLELESGRDALVLDRGDAEEIAAAVARLADDPALRASIGEQGRTFALRNLRWSRSVAAIGELYRRL